MGKSKNAYIRYRTLDRCFRDTRKRYFIEDLVEACNKDLDNYDGSYVSERQVREDIHFMQREAGGGVPLEIRRDGHKVYYRYSDPNFSILNLPISQREVELLNDTIQMLKRFKGMPKFSWMDETLVRLEETFNLKKESRGIVSFSQNEDLVGIGYFSKLFDAIINQQVLRIMYHSYDFIPWARVIHPYQLRQYNNRWFLVGKETGRNDRLPVVVLPLDRINEIDIIKEGHYLDMDLQEIESYFKDIVGVSIQVGKPVQAILLKVYKPALNYIVTKPFHHSQKIIEDAENYSVLKLELKPNFEFETQLLAYADSIEILEPLDLREKIVDRAKEIISRNNLF